MENTTPSLHFSLLLHSDIALVKYNFIVPLQWLTSFIYFSSRTINSRWVLYGNHNLQSAVRSLVYCMIICFSIMITYSSNLVRGQKNQFPELFYSQSSYREHLDANQRENGRTRKKCQEKTSYRTNNIIKTAIAIHISHNTSLHQSQARNLNKFQNQVPSLKRFKKEVKRSNLSIRTITNSGHYFLYISPINHSTIMHLPKTYFPIYWATNEIIIIHGVEFYTSDCIQVWHWQMYDMSIQFKV